MRNRSSITIQAISLFAIVVVLLVITATGCETDSKEKNQAKNAAKKESKEKASNILRTDISEQQARVEAAAKIDELRKAANPD